MIVGQSLPSPVQYFYPFLQVSDVPAIFKTPSFDISASENPLQFDMLVKTVCLLYSLHKTVPSQNTNSHLAPRRSPLVGSRSRSSRTSFPGNYNDPPTHLPGEQQLHQNHRRRKAQPRSSRPPLQLIREDHRPQRTWLCGHRERASMVYRLPHNRKRGLRRPKLLLVLPWYQGQLPALR